MLMNERFAVGQPVSRKEDPVLLCGEGRAPFHPLMPLRQRSPDCGVSRRSDRSHAAAGSPALVLTA